MPFILMLIQALIVSAWVVVDFDQDKTALSTAQAASGFGQETL
jgi:hypothetical protein